MIRSYEAIISISIISLALVMLFKNYESYYEEKVDRARIFKVLEDLDRKNLLRNYALQNDSEKIGNWLLANFPVYDFFVQICGLNCSKPNFTEEFISVTYLISGNFSNFEPKQIIVYVIP